MIVKQGEQAPHTNAVVDLTSTPYFSAPPVPSQRVVPREGSSRERIRETPDVPDAAASYRVDRAPVATDLRLGGGLGMATVLDVGAHPIRAKARRVDLMTVMAITVVTAVGLVMLGIVAAIRY